MGSRTPVTSLAPDADDEPHLRLFAEFAFQELIQLDFALLGRTLGNLAARGLQVGNAQGILVFILDGRDQVQNDLMTA